MFNLILIRKRVHLEIERIKKEEMQKKEEKKKQGWFGGWYRKKSTDSPATLSLSKINLVLSLCVLSKINLHDFQFL